jgi:hypothetical protein
VNQGKPWGSFSCGEEWAESDFPWQTGLVMRKA